MTNQAIVILITVPNIEVGQEIAKLLLEKRLAACINIVPGISSFFTWEGKTHQEQEALLIVKSRADLFETELLPAVKDAYSYEVPEIIAIPITMGSQEYLEWIRQETSAL